MKYKSSALVFPETPPAPHAMANLLIFFARLFCYLPTEPDGAALDNSEFSELYTSYAPAPLGNDLPRFNRLLHELETARPEEISRLFSAARVPGTTGQARDQDETSAGGVYAALQRDAAAITDIRHRERLWQARLILKLAEMLDRREADIRQGMARVSSIEQKVFSSLEGPGEAVIDAPAEARGHDKLRQPEADEIMPRDSSSGISGPLLPLRLKAWAELYLADPAAQQPLTLVTATPECGSLLLDGYENTWRTDPEKLFSLAVPRVDPAGFAAGESRYLASRNLCREAARDNLEYLAGYIRQTAGSSGSLTAGRENPSRLLQHVSAWNEKIKLHFPGPEKDCRKLDFYSFPGVPCTDLLQRLFHLEESAAKNKPQHPTGILAVLQP